MIDPAAAAAATAAVDDPDVFPATYAAATAAAAAATAAIEEELDLSVKHLRPFRFCINSSCCDSKYSYIGGAIVNACAITAINISGRATSSLTNLLL
jgi:hypothetical protein